MVTVQETLEKRENSQQFMATVTHCDFHGKITKHVIFSSVRSDAELKVADLLEEHRNLHAIKGEGMCDYSISQETIQEQ